MSLVDKIKDRYGWLVGQYPESVGQMVAQRPELKENVARGRYGGILQHAGKNMTVLSYGVIALPPIVSNDMQDLALKVGMLISGMVVSGVVENKGARAVSDLHDKIGYKEFDAHLAMYDLEGRIKDTLNDNTFGWMAAITAMSAAYTGHMLYAGTQGIGTMLVAAGTTALAAAVAVHAFRQARKGDERVGNMRAYVRKHKDDYELECLARAKDVTPRIPDPSPGAAA